MPHPTSRCAACGLALVTVGAVCPRCGGQPDSTWSVPASSTEAPEPVDSAAANASRLTNAFSPDRRFEVVETLGRGGMGVVYKARDRELDEVVAIKVLDPLVGSSDAAIERFKSEVRIARRINHPYVARLHELFLWHGRLAISMEFIAGRSMDELLAEHPLPIPTIRHYLRYIASALDAAHRLGVVHRDLKPANILIDAHDRTHILDFGIATLAGIPNSDTAGSVFGTPSYMSPEQAYRPESVDHRSDIYSLGVVLYRMATGTVPFAMDDPQDVFLAHLGSPVVPPSHVVSDLPAGFDQIVLRCLEKEPARRFASAREVQQTLEDMLDGGAPVSRASPSVAVRTQTSTGVRGRVLLVDDDRFARQVIGDLLRSLGVEVLEARDGYDGVEVALRERPDFILLDLVMPVLDGREALRILKSNPRSAGIPVVMLTGLEDPEEAMLSREMGAAMYLNKPVEPDVLELLVEKYTSGMERARP